MYILSYYDITFHHRAQIIEMIPTWLLFDCYWNEKKEEKKKKQEACNREKSYKRKIAKKKGKIVIRCFIVYRFEHRYAQFIIDLPVDRISRALPH